MTTHSLASHLLTEGASHFQESNPAVHETITVVSVCPVQLWPSLADAVRIADILGIKALTTVVALRMMMVQCWCWCWCLVSSGQSAGEPQTHRRCNTHTMDCSIYCLFLAAPPPSVDQGHRLAPGSMSADEQEPPCSIPQLRTPHL